MLKDSKILILGATGLVGSAVVRQLEKQGYDNLLTPSSNDVDLLDEDQVLAYFNKNKPEYVFLCAAKVGGIKANSTYPVEFLADNITIGLNVLKHAYEQGVKKLLNLGSTCIYPKMCPQPIKEEYLLSSALEPSNEAYAIAKIAILKQCEYYNKQYGTQFISAMPTNVYGPNDNYHPENSHVLPAIIRKVHELKESKDDTIEIWGDGSPVREFVFSEDLADAMIFLMNNYDGSRGIVNIGTGKGVSIKEAYETAMDAIGVCGWLKYDASKPNGTPIKISDVSLLNELGFECKTTLKEGIMKTYNDLKQKGFTWKEK